MGNYMQHAVDFEMQITRTYTALQGTPEIWRVKGHYVKCNLIVNDTGQ